jgi:hypothetical protein
LQPNAIKEWILRVVYAIRDLTNYNSMVSAIINNNRHHGRGGNHRRGKPADGTPRTEIIVATGADISEADWVTILAAAKVSAAKLGATDEQVMQDGPSNHDVGFLGPAGTFIKIGYQGNLCISAFTGCRLPQDKKKPQS